MGSAAGFVALAKMRKSLAQMQRVPSRAATAATKEIQAHVDAQFSAGIDPYGNAWEGHADATVKRWGEHPILDLTGELAGGVTVSPSRGSGIKATIDEEYGVFHQIGTANMPARVILPDGRGLPDTWRRSIADACDKAFSEAAR